LERRSRPERARAISTIVVRRHQVRHVRACVMNGEYLPRRLSRTGDSWLWT